MPNTRAQIEEKIADRIIALLDLGELPPWERPWKSSMGGTCRNAVSSRPYRGINRWLTMLTQILMNYDDPRWLTFKQAQGLNGNVKKGEKSTDVIFFKITTKQEPHAPVDLEEPDRPKTYPVMRIYHVFNVEQTEGCKLNPLPKEDRTQHNPIETAEAIVRAMPDPPKTTRYEHSNTSPCYQPNADLVRIPVQGRYNRIEDWYNTLFHELVHSTGHPKRLDRFARETQEDSLHSYGQEELVAGMGAAMLGEQAGTGHLTLEQNAAYIKHWRDAIAADKGIVIRAAALAQKAVDHITGHQQEYSAEPQTGKQEVPPAPERNPEPVTA